MLIDLLLLVQINLSRDRLQLWRRFGRRHFDHPAAVVKV